MIISNERLTEIERLLQTNYHLDRIALVDLLTALRDSQKKIERLQQERGECPHA